MAGAAAVAPVLPPGPHDTLANMLAHLLTLCLLALTALPVARSIDDETTTTEKSLLNSYKTVEARVLSGVRLRRGPSYLLPAGKCNVTLTPLEMCGSGLVVASLEVTVVNPNGQYAEVLFEMKDHDRVRVLLPSCLLPSKVDLRLACLRRKLSRSHSRVPLLVD